MQIKQLFNDTHAVVLNKWILLPTLLVILAAVIGGVMLGEKPSPPQTQFEYEATAGETLSIVHQGGDSFQGENVYIQYDGQTTTNISDQFGQNTITTDSIYTSNQKLASDQTVQVIWKSPQNDSTTQIGTFEVEQTGKLNANAPTVDFDYEANNDGTYTITHAGGSNFDASTIKVQYNDGTTENWGTSSEVTTGDSYTTGEPVTGSRIQIMWTGERSNSTIGLYTIPS